MLTKAFLFFSVLLACSSLQDKTVLYQHWIHSHEEDKATEGNRTYRPASFAFPFSRGRDGFEIKKDGVIISHPIAPSDGNLDIEEKWKLEDDTLIIEGKDRISKYKIISLTSEKLVMKPL